MQIGIVNRAEGKNLHISKIQNGDGRDNGNQKIAIYPQPFNRL